MVKYVINYEGKNITNDISGKLISLTYIDRLEGRASSLEIQLEDKNKLFAGAWYPQVGDVITCAVGNEGDPLLDCGSFFVDEFECNADRSDILTTIKGLSVNPKHIYAAQRIKNYSGKNFSEIANEIASELGMSVTGELSGVVKQNSHQTGLAFLFELSKKMGLIMKIEKNIIHFEKYEKLKKNPSILIQYNDSMSVNIKDKAQGIYNSCTCKWWDAKAKTMYSGTYELGIKGGTATIWEDVDDDSQAEDKAKNWLDDKQKQKANIDIKMIGDVRFLSGVSVEIKGFGKNDAKYIIKETKHEITRQGYFSQIFLQR